MPQIRSHASVSMLQKPGLWEAWLFSDLFGEAILGTPTVFSIMEIIESSKKINQIEKNSKPFHGKLCLVWKSSIYAEGGHGDGEGWWWWQLCGEALHGTPFCPSGPLMHGCLCPPAFFTTWPTSPHSYSLDSHTPCSESSSGNIIAQGICSSVLSQFLSYLSFELHYNYLFLMEFITPNGGKRINNVRADLHKIMGERSITDR